MSLGTPTTTPPSLADIATAPGWLKLLHYDKTWTGQWRSRADGEGFFVAPQGKQDPLAELRATLAAFQDPAQRFGLLQQPAVCAFPARFLYLKPLLHLSIPPTSCKDFDEWRQGLSTTSVSLVFSTAYANNPASMFGHTFLRLNSSKAGQASHELLHYGVSFQAVVEDDSRDFLYVYKALAGKYQGQFSIAPYYMKVNEYNGAENRDLWEYQLQLSPDEVDLLVAHIWEIYTTTYFDYYFQDENCSYMLLAMLEAVRPSLDLRPRLSLFVLPSETVKRVAGVSGLINHVSFRPANMRQLRSQVATLTKEQRQQFFELKNDSTAVDLAAIDDAATLNAANDWYAMRKARSGQLPKNEADAQHAILRRRAQLGVRSEANVDVPPANNRPDLGHGHHSLSLSAHHTQSTMAYTIGYKLGYHDLLDDDRGYEQLLQINYFDIAAIYYEEQENYDLYRFHVADIISLNSWSRLTPDFSWRLLAGYEDEQIVGEALGGIASLVDDSHIFYAMAGVRVGHNNRSHAPTQIKADVVGAWIASWPNDIKTQLQVASSGARATLAFNNLSDAKLRLGVEKKGRLNDGPLEHNVEFVYDF